jgi:hypothetical protein
MKVITSVVNNPIFIEIQYFTLKKHIQFEFEFIVFNDAKSFPDFTNYNDISIKPQIENTCKKLNIKHINIPNDNHKAIKDASFRTAEAMNFILDYQIKNPDKYLLLDSDMWLINDLYLDELICDCAVVLQKRDNYQYIWNGLFFFDTLKLNMELMNWHCTHNTDTGGCMNKWLIEAKQTNNIKYINHFQSLKWNHNDIVLDNKKLLDFLQNDKRNKADKFYSELYLNKFLHYRGGGNWKRDAKNDDNIYLYLKDIFIN